MRVNEMDIRSISVRYMVAGNEKGGAAVVLVIWVMVILLALVAEFSYSMRTEIKITRNFKEEEEAYQLALAGIELAKNELMSISNLRGIYLNDDANVLILDPNEDEELPERKGELGTGSYEYDISDEDGKININTATPQQLREILENSGARDDSEVSTIVDSILDWRDTDDLHRLNGAEEDYYRSLDRPYSCKDGNFDVLEELLLVKGMKPEIFYGSHIIQDNAERDQDEEDARYSGLRDYLTVTGVGRVNMNTAPEPVLWAVLPAAAANIISQRQAGLRYAAGSGGKADSQFFRIISTGRNSDGSITRTINTIVHRQPGDLITLYWNDNIVK
jgi:type II secretory pathway component PulK